MSIYLKIKDILKIEEEKFYADAYFIQEGIDFLKENGEHWVATNVKNAFVNIDKTVTNLIEFGKYTNLNYFINFDDMMILYNRLQRDWYTVK